MYLSDHGVEAFILGGFYCLLFILSSASHAKQLGIHLTRVYTSKIEIPAAAYSDYM